MGVRFENIFAWLFRAPMGLRLGDKVHTRSGSGLGVANLSTVSLTYPCLFESLLAVAAYINVLFLFVAATTCDKVRGCERGPV